MPRDERLAGNQNFHDFIKERKNEGRKEGRFKGGKKTVGAFSRRRRRRRDRRMIDMHIYIYIHVTTRHREARFFSVGPSFE